MTIETLRAAITTGVTKRDAIEAAADAAVDAHYAAYPDDHTGAAAAADAVMASQAPIVAAQALCQSAVTRTIKGLPLPAGVDAAVALLMA